MKLYHGSHTKIEKPLLTFSNKNRDFGSGFYLTSDLASKNLVYQESC